MRLANFARIPAFLLGLIFVPVALAADDEMLPCDGACALATEPVGISTPKPIFPSRYLSEDGFAEGMVLFQFTVGTDGHVSDITTLKLVGPQEFEDSAKAVLQNWVYKPAAVKGEPVAISSLVRFVFSYRNEGWEARRSIVYAYHSATSLIKDGKLDVALTGLTEAQAQPALTFYERGLIATLQALIQNNKHNYWQTEQLVHVPVYYYEGTLPPQIVLALCRARIEADLNLGDLADAIRSVVSMKTVRGFDSKDPLVRLVAETREKMDALPAFDAEGKIPERNDAEAFRIELYRRNFTLHNLSAPLQRLNVGCRQGEIQSPISEKAEWHIPKNFNGCYLTVYGTPGTTFRLSQFRD